MRTRRAARANAQLVLDEWGSPCSGVNRAPTAGRPGRAADNEPRRLRGQGALPLALRLNDELGSTGTMRSGSFSLEWKVLEP